MVGTADNSAQHRARANIPESRSGKIAEVKKQIKFLQDLARNSEGVSIEQGFDAINTAFMIVFECAIEDKDLTQEFINANEAAVNAIKAKFPPNNKSAPQ